MYQNFEAFAFQPTIYEALGAMGYESPTAIQQQAIPAILAGNDLVGLAQTGTGKTAAFLLPILDRLVREKKSHTGAQVLIVAPTRELVLQIDQQLEGFSYFTSISSMAIHGGSDRDKWAKQRRAIDADVDIIVATPGRLIQFIQLGITKFEHLHTLVLDEADLMLDMGFLPDIEQIISSLPAGRQTLLFSATMDPQIRQLSNKYLQSPVEVNIAGSKPVEKIAQFKAIIPGGKSQFLAAYLHSKPELSSVIVFVERKIHVMSVQRELSREKISVLAIHSNLSQEERQSHLEKFKARQVRVLIGTDVIGRGIDISDVDLVVNYQVPRSKESYVHRIGRTARAEQKGESLLLAVPAEQRDLSKLEKMLGLVLADLPAIPGFDIAQLPVDPVVERRGSRGRKLSKRKGSTPNKEQSSASRASTPRKSRPKRSASRPRKGDDKPSQSKE